jgi:hypothetical protein
MLRLMEPKRLIDISYFGISELSVASPLQQGARERIR